MEKNSTTADMPTLTACLEQAKKDGYAKEFKVNGNGLSVINTDKCFKPEDVKVDNFYRFEGASDPGDSTILYLISTNDGTKGTLSDAFGTYADSKVTAFMDQVEEISKKTK